MNRRNTIQKDLVLNTVQALKSHVTADEVYEKIKIDYPNIGKGTVYRNLNILVEEGKIRKVEIPGGPDRFDFTLQEHYHIKCIRCNKVCDIDLEEIPNLLTLVRKNERFKVLSYDILFKGICLECQKEINNK